MEKEDREKKDMEKGDQEKEVREQEDKEKEARTKENKELEVGWLRNSILKISRSTKFWRNYFEFRENKIVDFHEIFAKFLINIAQFS